MPFKLVVFSFPPPFSIPMPPSIFKGLPQTLEIGDVGRGHKVLLLVASDLVLRGLCCDQDEIIHGNTRCHKSNTKMYQKKKKNPLVSSQILSFSTIMTKHSGD